MSVIASKKEIKPNLKQQECIDNINGFYMVLAGPGTGKTFTLTRRIKEMIEKHNIKPEEILCLTYSETAANEMKTKLINLLGNIAVNLHISTYHSFCNEIIQNYPDKFNLQENVKLIDAISKDLLAKKSDFAVYEAIRGMLPKNRLGRKMIKHVRVYKDAAHGHEAQKPEKIELKGKRV